MSEPAFTPQELGRTLAGVCAWLAVVLAVATAWLVTVRRPALPVDGGFNPPALVHPASEEPGAYPAPKWQPGFRNYFTPVRTASERAHRRR